MKELDILQIINSTLTDNSFIGDDCAELENNMVVSQDSLVEDVHFNLNIISAYMLGFKSVAVNFSDIAAALAKPLYITISISLPANINNVFVRDFYKGVNDICNQFKVKVVGGDITGSSKIFISVCAIGKHFCEYKSSRKYAKIGDIVFTTGIHGLSSLGLWELLNNKTNVDEEFSNAHLCPIPNIIAAENLAQNINDDIAVMDTSDGLGDALYRISKMSKVTLNIDYNNLKISKKFIKTAKNYGKSIDDFVFWGGEDYHLLCCAPKNVFDKLDKNLFFEIGRVEPLQDKNVIIKNSSDLKFIDEYTFEKNTFNHFN